MYYNYIPKDAVDPISGRPVLPQMPVNHSVQTPLQRERTVREDLEAAARMLEEQERQQSMMPKQPPYLEFNGKELSWYDNGQRYRSWPAMSGRADYQSPEYQNVAKKRANPRRKLESAAGQISKI